MNPLALCALLSLSCAAPKPHALMVDTTAPQQLQVVFSQPVRDSLARAWNDTDPHQVERVACLTYSVERVPVNLLRVTLTGFLPPDTVLYATTYSVGYRCPLRTLDLHTHPPVTCPVIGAFDHDWKHCVIGGNGAWLCFASDQDKKSLAAGGQGLAFVQCDKYAIIPFFPLEPPRSK